MNLTKRRSISIKEILTHDHAWWNFYNQFKDSIRDGIRVAIVKLLSCKNTVRGYHQYACANPDCPHIKRVPHTCKSKACSSCGKKATENWLKQQAHSLPQTPFQHITFTMPCELWDFFWFNRPLLQYIAKIAANTVLKLARKRGLTPGIFVAIHTFGRDLKRNVHIHLSTTTSGISDDLSQWKSLYFHQKTLMSMWRYEIITLFRKFYQQQQLVIPQSIQKHLNPHFTFNHFLNRLINKNWIVNCSTPNKNHAITMEYFARYIKRPVIAEYRLRHYDGAEVVFAFLNHHTKKTSQMTLTTFDFIRRFIQHIPDVGFRMIRYYGFPGQSRSFQDVA